MSAGSCHEGIVPTRQARCRIAIARLRDNIHSFNSFYILRFCQHGKSYHVPNHWCEIRFQVVAKDGSDHYRTGWSEVELSQNHHPRWRTKLTLLKVAIDDGFQIGVTTEGQTFATLLFMQQFKTVALRLSFTSSCCTTCTKRGAQIAEIRLGLAGK